MSSAYLTKIAQQAILAADVQLSHAARIDRLLRHINRAIAHYPVAWHCLAHDLQQTTAQGASRRIVARIVLAEPETLDKHHEVAIISNFIRNLTTMTDNLPDTAIPLRVDLLNGYRLRNEYAASLIETTRSDVMRRQLNRATWQHFSQQVETAVVRIRSEIEHLVQGNQKLVVSIARQFRHSPIPFMDLVQEGNLGILRTIERFDHRRNTRFSTYAAWWIRRAMIYAIARHSHDIKPSISLFWQSRQVQRARNVLEQHLGRAASNHELCNYLNISGTELANLALHNLPPLALDAPLRSEDELCWSDLLANHSAINQEDNLQHEALKNFIKSVLNRLPHRHALILRLRFGIDVHKSCTLEQIAQQQNVTRERIRQLESQALLMIKKHIDPELLMQYL